MDHRFNKLCQFCTKEAGVPKLGILAKVRLCRDIASPPAIDRPLCVVINALMGGKTNKESQKEWRCSTLRQVVID